jgi:HicA toxin of bacterial toxin-antitoxin,
MHQTDLSRKNQNILQRIFDEPIRSNVQWKELISLLKALGAEISEGTGSRTRIALNGVRAVFHRPHPRKEVDKGALKDVRRFLTTAGILP